MEALSFKELNQLKETDIVCEEYHFGESDPNLVYIEGHKPFCPLCVKHRINDKNEFRVSLVSERIAEKVHKFMSNNSIVSDETLLNASFDNYQTIEKETTENKKLARKIAGEYLYGSSYNTIITGNPGSGKSHLAMSMLKAINENSDPYRYCLFVSFDDALRKIRSSFDNKESKYTEEYMIELMAKPHILVIDDLGAETGYIGTIKQASDFTQRILYSVMNQRQNKSTIITTNLNSEELSKMYDPKLLSRMYKGSKGHIISFKTTKDKRMEVEF